MTPPAETTTSISAAASTLFLGRNGEFWDFWLIMSVIIAAFAAAGVGVTTIGSIVSHKREAEASDRELERFKTETGGKITEANSRALEARAALEQYKAARFLSPKQNEQLDIVLSSFPPGKIRIWKLPSGSDVSGLADQLASSFAKAKWQVSTATSLSGKTISGIVVIGKIKTPLFDTFAVILNKLFAEFKLRSVAEIGTNDGGLSPASNVSGPDNDPDIIIVVGSK